MSADGAKADILQAVAFICKVQINKYSGPALGLPSVFTKKRSMKLIILSIALLEGLSGVAFAQTETTAEIAPGAKLRVGMISITVLGGVAEPGAAE